MHVLNPYQNVQAFAGFDRSLSSTLMYRSQWTPVTGGPKYLHLNMHLPIYFLNGGAGILFEQEELGIETNRSLKLSYNIVFQTSLGIISGGASLGFEQKSLGGDEIITPTGIYEPGGGIIHNDPLLPNTTINGVRPTWALSVLWQYENLTTGLQLDDFFNSGVNFGNVNYESTKVITLISDYQYKIDENITIRPNMMMVTNLKNLQLNLGMLCNYGNIFGGINLRGWGTNSIESLGIISGIQFNKHYTLAYSYDLGLSSLKSQTEGSHEVIFKYNLNKIINTGLPPRIIYNPRDL